MPYVIKEIADTCSVKLVKVIAVVGPFYESCVFGFVSLGTQVLKWPSSYESH